MGAVFTKADQAGHSEDVGCGGDWNKGRKQSRQRTARASMQRLDQQEGSCDCDGVREASSSDADGALFLEPQRPRRACDVIRGVRRSQRGFGPGGRVEGEGGRG